MTMYTRLTTDVVGLHIARIIYILVHSFNFSMVKHDHQW